MITVLALLLVLSATSQSIGTVISSLISSIGILVSFYYGLSGLACVWYYRRLLRRDWGTLIMRGVWTGAAALFLLILGMMQIPALGWALYTLGAIAIGVLIMLYFQMRYRSPFYAAPAECHDPTPSKGVCGD